MNGSDANHKIIPVGIFVTELFCNQKKYLLYWPTGARTFLEGGYNITCYNKKGESL